MCSGRIVSVVYQTFQETTGIPGAGEGLIPIPGQNMVIPADNSRPHPLVAGEGVLFPAPALAKSYPRSFTEAFHIFEVKLGLWIISCDRFVTAKSTYKLHKTTLNHILQFNIQIKIVINSFYYYLVFLPTILIERLVNLLYRNYYISKVFLDEP